MSILDKKLVKGRIYRQDDISQYIDFQYNPPEIADALGVEWNEAKGAGMSYAAQQYGGGKTRTFNIEIYFNDREKKGTIKKSINFLHGFLPPARTEGYQFVAPSPLIFSFGWMVKPCLLQTMDIKYDFFNNQLNPLMCTVTIGLIVIQ